MIGAFRTAGPLAFATIFAAALWVSPASHGQAIERNLPPAPTEQAQGLAVPNALPGNEDDTPIGPALSGITLLGPSDAVHSAPATGIDTTLLPRLNTADGRAILQPFIGRPISRKLIGEIESAIAREYRLEGFPFVSLSTPPQKIGGGVLQIRVIEFHAGSVTVKGANEADAAFIRNRVRLQPGDAIDAPLLSDDLEWLNRYPFRQVEAVFSPGGALSQTDLDLNVTENKPWNVFAGYANSGSPSSGLARYSLGGQVGGLLTPDTLLSYQFTTSSDFWVKNGDLFGETGHPRYLSHGARLIVPTEPRQEIEASFDHVESNIRANPFAVRQITDELTLGYRSAVSNWIRLPGDLSGGVEIKREQRRTFFLGVDVVDNALDIVQGYLGWSDVWTDRWGKGSANVTVHASPGGFNTQNEDAAFALFTNGRVTGASYAYVNAQAAHYTRLGGRWAISTTLIGQYTGGALPDTEQLGVGGQELVRGYTLDDGAYDSAIIARNELRFPTFPVLSGWTGLADQLSPFAFVDAGYGTENGVHRDITPVSIGAGADYQLSDHLTANVMTAYAIDRGVEIIGGNWRFLIQTRLQF